MKLKALRVHGFKSFADVTEVVFHDGITAIVGPNGCGKSNISDAIRWVLGEQRPTAIRGAKMEEAIFQGSLQRRPVNRGSVSMIVTNENGALPVPFEEVEIGRTVYRDGRSDYSVNRSSVRLRDVVDLVRDTGLGANAYSVIENRMIDAILSDRAEERRALFEEAAGIGKYKDRRKSATRRLERADLDLQRLEDVIAEVQSKVRSLARQKGKAERYLALRARRLSVEVTVVTHRLAALSQRREQIQKALAGEHQTEKGKVAELRTAEADVERFRIDQVDAERNRSQAAERLDAVRSELVGWERDLAVAAERAGYAERRVQQIDHERSTAQEQMSRLASDAAKLAQDEADVVEVLGKAQIELDASRAKADEVRQRLVKARTDLERRETREREIARRSAQLEGDGEAAKAQAGELERRLLSLTEELESTSVALTELEGQTDLFDGRLEGLASDVAGARSGLVDGERVLEELRGRLGEARRLEVEVLDLARTVTAELSALEGLERSEAGVATVVKEALAANVSGVLAPLMDSIEASATLVAAVEAYLGQLSQALVVQDQAAASRLVKWFREWGGGGGLIVLPLDSVPAPQGPFLEGVTAKGPGAPWVEALLSGVTLVGDTELFSDGQGGVRLTRDGTSRDARGIIRVGNPGGGGGVLERREHIRTLTLEAKELNERAAEAVSARERLQAEADRAEGAREASMAALRAAEDVERAAKGDAAAQFDHRGRMDRHKNDLARQVEGTRASRARALERARDADDDRDSLLREEETLRRERDEARSALAGVQEEWEVARSEENRLAVEATRAEGELERLRERRKGAEEGHASAEARLSALTKEETELRGELERAATLREDGAIATATLFSQRDEAEADLRERDTVLQTVLESLRESERKARDARQAEREALDLRHRLELERQELEGNIGRLRDRLEGEWGKSLETLIEEAEPLGEGDPTEPESLEEELRLIVAGLERIGLVNMLAVEEHLEESERLAFLEEQHGDLIEARDDLRSAIKHINETATGLFSEVFEKIRDNFRAVHSRLFEGGEADLWMDDEGDPLESIIEIHASPRGKKTQRIDLLSGGERALTALSLLFAIYLVKPSPFCVLDEVDAPLDENNIGRFIRLLEEFKSQTQFVVITHNPRTIEAADWIYGVTMEEPGVSTMVGVRLEDALAQARGAA